VRHGVRRWQSLLGLALLSERTDLVRLELCEPEHERAELR
jgi:hypothetical protein